MSTNKIKQIATAAAGLFLLGHASSASAAQAENDRWEDTRITSQSGYIPSIPNPADRVMTRQRAIVVAQNQAGVQTHSGQPNRAEYENQRKKEINGWSLGIAAGNSWGTPTQMATELANVLDDGKNLHIVPMLSRGPAANIDALLYLRGADMAIVNTDVLNYYKKNRQFLNVDKRINYIAQLYLSELHVLARTNVKSLSDLKGKVVNFNSRGTAASFSGPRVFEGLGLRVRQKYLPNQLAIDKLKQGKEIDAVVYMTGKPVHTLKDLDLPKDVHLVPVKFNAALTESYLPTQLKHEDYPNLIPKGERISTISVPTLLAVYNWRANSKRYFKVERFIQYMLKRWKTFQSASFHPKWKAINLNAKIPGWKRFPAMQEQLDLMARLNRDSILKTASARKSQSKSDKKLKIAFDRFLRNYARANGLSTFTPSQREKLFRQFHKFWRETGN